MIDLTEIIIALIGLVATVLTTFLIPYLRQKMSAEKFSEMQMWVNIAVKAAEMLYAGTGRGEEKKAYVVETLYKIVPTYYKSIIKKDFIELLVQTTFDDVESFAKKQN